MKKIGLVLIYLVLLLDSLYAQNSKEIYSVLSVNGKLCLPNHLPNVKLILNENSYNLIDPVTLQANSFILAEGIILEFYIKKRRYKSSKINLNLLKDGGVFFLDINTKKKIFELNYYNLLISGELVSLKE